MKQENTTYILKLFTKVCSDVVAKCIATGGIVVANFFVDGLLAKSMLAIFFLMMFDWITGVAAAKKTGDNIASSKILRTPIKIAIYFMLITAARIAEFSLPDAIRYLDETVIAFLAMTELISILENTGKLGYAVPIKLLERLKALRDQK